MAASALTLPKLQAKQAAALQDVETEVERLRVKAAAKARSLLACRRKRLDSRAAQVREFLLQRFYGLRKPKTNIQARRRVRRIAP